MWTMFLPQLIEDTQKSVDSMAVLGLVDQILLTELMCVHFFFGFKMWSMPKDQSEVLFLLQELEFHNDCMQGER